MDQSSSPPPSEAPESAEPSRTSGLAKTSLICGILAPFALLALSTLSAPFDLLIPFALVSFLTALITGHLGLFKISKNPNLSGSGMAFAGAMLGYAGVIFLVLMALHTPIRLKREKMVAQAVEMHQVRDVYYALTDYDFDGETEHFFPKDLAEFERAIPAHILTGFLKVPAHSAQGWLYFPGRSTKDAAERLLLVGPVIGEKQPVLYVDGSTKVLKPKDVSALLAAEPTTPIELPRP